MHHFDFTCVVVFHMIIVINDNNNIKFEPNGFKSKINVHAYQSNQEIQTYLNVRKMGYFTQKQNITRCLRCTNKKAITTNRRRVHVHSLIS
jgi:hypothetical protein